jgi:hypothetical protein
MHSATLGVCPIIHDLIVQRARPTKLKGPRNDF